MTKDSKHFEVRSPEGTLMFSVQLVDESSAQNNGQQPPKPNAAANPAGKSQKPRDSDGQKDTSLMTDAQKRYLLKILADRGFDEDAAERELHELFHVADFSSVTKEEASAAIKRLLREDEQEIRH